jgi:NAD(P)-dependent dehydrogenase (short-subunit alcohol dehydrogenase family)
MQQIEGKTVVVTGAASGMGRAMAARFGRAGMNVVAADVEQPALDDAVAALRETGVDVVAVVADVSLPEDNERLAATALEQFGGAHVVCLNAGVGGPLQVALPDLTLDDWSWVLGVNLWGPIHGTRTFLPRLLEQGDGHIVYTSSMAGLLPGALGPYSVAKHGVVALATGVEAYAREAASGVGVSVLCPGFVNTRIIDSGRNRPERWRDTGKSDESEANIFATEQGRALLEAGTAPEVVADLVHDAVVEGRFWIYTDEMWGPVVRAYHTQIEQGINPQPIASPVLGEDA